MACWSALAIRLINTSSERVWAAAARLGEAAGHSVREQAVVIAIPYHHAPPKEHAQQRVSAGGR
jgi:hypothetical protein